MMLLISWAIKEAIVNLWSTVNLEILQKNVIKLISLSNENGLIVWFLTTFVADVQ